MIGPYLEKDEMDRFNATLLDHVLEDTLRCWEMTRLRGKSASMSCDGNISIPLLRAFDKVRKNIEEIV